MINGQRVIDSHCHIYPDKIALRAAEGTGKFYEFAPAADGTLGGLIADGTAVGIDHFVVQSVATTPHQVRSINEFIANAVAADSRLTGLGTLHPDSEDIAADFAHLRELGLRGVKLHPDIQRFKTDDYRCLKIYELCEAAGLPLLLHTGDSRFDFSNPNRVLPILKIYTNLTVIGAHLGGWSVWDEAEKTLADLPNFYVDCSSCMPFIDHSRVANLIRRYGAERVLFGTDYPMFLPSNELPDFLALGFTEDEYRLMLHDNACRLYHITD